MIEWEAIDAGLGYEAHASLVAIEYPKGLKVHALAFDCLRCESACFRGRWQWGSEVSVGVSWTSDFDAAVYWAFRVQAVKEEGWWRGGGQAIRGNAIIKLSEKLKSLYGPGHEHRIEPGEEFMLCVSRYGHREDDTLAGDAHLLKVILTNDDAPLIMTPGAISDEEYARRSGFYYRGKK